MPRVLIPTNDASIIPHIAQGYAALGYEVVVGVQNFFLCQAEFDLVHLMWPEELVGWQVPTERQLNQVETALEKWVARIPVIALMHNLYPHGQEGNPYFRRLFDSVYSRCKLVVHQSSISRDLLLQEFSGARYADHIITNMFNYDALLPERLDREAARNYFGLKDESFALLIFGAVRFRVEAELIRRGFNAAQVKAKALIMGGRYAGDGNRVTRRWRDWQWKSWAKSHGTEPLQGFIPDESLHLYFEAADAVLVPRIKDISSGLIGLACTFGRTLIVPDHGAYACYLAGTDNPFYRSGDAASLAKAIERTALMDRSVTEKQNRNLADGWGWEKILQTSLDAIK